MSLGGGDGVEETPYEQETARIAQIKFDYLRPQLNEAEDMYIERVQEMNTAGEFEQVGGDVQTAVNAEFGKAGGTLTSSMARGGVDPSSGKFGSTLKNFADDHGTASSDAVNRSQSAQQDRAMTSLGNVVAMGEGQSAQAIDGMFEVASNSAGYARQKASESLQRNENKNATLGFVAGAGYEMGGGGNVQP